MMMSYFKGTVDAVAEYCTAVSCPNAPNTSLSPWNINKHLPYQLTPVFVACAGPKLKRFTLLVDVEWPSLTTSVLVAQRQRLPPTKRFDFTMVDDDFEESQRSFTP